MPLKNTTTCEVFKNNKCFGYPDDCKNCKEYKSMTEKKIDEEIKEIIIRYTINEAVDKLKSLFKEKKRENYCSFKDKDSKCRRSGNIYCFEIIK